MNVRSATKEIVDMFVQRSHLVQTIASRMGMSLKSLFAVLQTMSTSAGLKHRSPAR